MCKPKIKQEKVEPVAQAAPPAQPAATVNQAGPQTPDGVAPEKAVMRSKRKGRSALRINLEANTGGGATGLNIPKG